MQTTTNKLERNNYEIDGDVYVLGFFNDGDTLPTTVKFLCENPACDHTEYVDISHPEFAQDVFCGRCTKHMDPMTWEMQFAHDGRRLLRSIEVANA